MKTVKVNKLSFGKNLPGRIMGSAWHHMFRIRERCVNFPLHYESNSIKDTSNDLPCDGDKEQSTEEQRCDNMDAEVPQCS